MFPQTLSQHLQRAKQMGFHAALRTTHGLSRLSHIQLLPDTQEKRLLLPKRQGAQGDVECRTGPLALHFFIGCRCRLISYLRQRIFSLFFVLGAMKKFPQPVSYPFPSVPIANAALQNTVKQRCPFFLRPLRILLRKFQHGILDEIQRLILIPRGNMCHAECPPLDACQKPIQCLGSIQ